MYTVRKEGMSESNNQKSTNSQWGGRFSEAVDTFVEKFTASIEFDQRMYRQDIAGSVAHATMLEKVGVLTPDELEQILTGLKEVQEDIESGQLELSLIHISEPTRPY